MELNPLRPGARLDALGALSQTRERPSEEAPPAPPPSVDEAIISLEARRRAQLDAAVGEGPEVRETLVADLRAAILSNRYELDPEAIARGLIGQDADSAPDA